VPISFRCRQFDFRLSSRQSAFFAIAPFDTRCQRHYTLRFFAAAADEFRHYFRFSLIRRCDNTIDSRFRRFFRLMIADIFTFFAIFLR